MEILLWQGLQRADILVELIECKVDGLKEVKLRPALLVFWPIVADDIIFMIATDYLPAFVLAFLLD